MNNSTTSGTSFVSLLDEKAPLEILSQAILNLWDTVNNLTRLRSTKRELLRSLCSIKKAS